MSTRRRKFAPTAAGFASMALLSACVTINVYFPAAEAKEAAKEFVEKVIGDELPNGVKPEAKPEESKPLRRVESKRAAMRAWIAWIAGVLIVMSGCACA